MTFIYKMLDFASLGFIVYVAIYDFILDFNDYLVLILIGVPCIFNLAILLDPNTLSLVIKEPYAIGYVPIILTFILYTIATYLFVYENSLILMSYVHVFMYTLYVTSEVNSYYRVKVVY